MPAILAAATAAFGSLTAAARMLGADTLCMAIIKYPGALGIGTTSTATSTCGKWQVMHACMRRMVSLRATRYVMQACVRPRTSAGTSLGACSYTSRNRYNRSSLVPP